MVGVAQLVERRLVVADVAGSKPVTHPHVRGPVSLWGTGPRARCRFSECRAPPKATSDGMTAGTVAIRTGLAAPHM